MYDTVIGLAKYGTIGVVSGFTLAVAAVQTAVPSEIVNAVTPDIHTSIIALIGGSILFAFKNYVPSEKKVDTQFREQTNFLLSKLEDLAFKPIEKMNKDMADHRWEVGKWMGRTDERLNSIESRCRIEFTKDVKEK
jgi:hypothetical protein